MVPRPSLRISVTLACALVGLASACATSDPLAAGGAGGSATGTTKSSATSTNSATTGSTSGTDASSSTGTGTPEPLPYPTRTAMRMKGLQPDFWPNRTRSPGTTRAASR